MKYCPAVCIMFFSALITLSTLAQPGTPDSSFGASGYVFGSVPGRIVASFEAGAAQPDGKIIAAGGGTSAGAAHSDFVLMRYNPDGTLDPRFGTEGIVTTDFGSTNEMIFAFALQQDGKMVSAGRISDIIGSSLGCGVTRHLSDGTPDPTFGTAGKLILELFEEINALVLQPDNKIVLAGSSFYFPLMSPDFVVARLLPDGSLDPSFGDHGKVITDLRSGNDLAASATLQSDGKILVAGDAGGDIGLVRYNSDGSLDLTFGVNGKVVTDIRGSSNDAGRSVVLHNNKIVVGGWSLTPGVNQGGYVFAIVRYNIDGTLDPTFGNNGITTTDFGPGNETIYEILLRDNKIVVAGTASQDSMERFDENYDLAIARYTDAGQLDTSFGDGGKVHSDFSAGTGLISADAAKALVYHNNTLYGIGSVGRFPGNEEVIIMGVVAAYKLEPITTCYTSSISNLSATPDVIWPPNHKMKRVTLNYNVTGNCPGDVKISITSNESKRRGRNHHNNEDWKVIDDHHILLRAERNKNGTRRVYTIKVSGKDASGNKISAKTEVIVPGSRSYHSDKLLLEEDSVDARSNSNDLSVKILSNPSSNYFTAEIGSNSGAPVSIRVFDIYGKTMETWKGNAGDNTFRFGYEYRPGIYFVEVLQNKLKKNVKVIKIR